MRAVVSEVQWAESHRVGRRFAGDRTPNAFGTNMTRFFTAFGDFAIFTARVVVRGVRPHGGFRGLRTQLHRVGVESLTVVNLCAFGIGLVMVLQSAYLLRRYGAEAQVATLMSASFVREIGPVFSAVMFAGRVGTGIAAELASMVVTEQVDAYRAFGTDPIGRLAAPRVLATTLMLPALTAIANVVGIFSGFLMGTLELGVSPEVYLANTRDALTAWDVVSSLSKGATFGFLVGAIATFKGFRTRRATDAVGESTTETMVACVLSILLADVVLTKLFLFIG